MFDNIVNMRMMISLIHCADGHDNKVDGDDNKVDGVDNKVDGDGKSQDNSSHGKSPSQT